MTNHNEDQVFCSGCGVLFHDNVQPLSQTSIYDVQGDLDYIELFCDECAALGMGEDFEVDDQNRYNENEAIDYEDYDHDDLYDFDSAMTSAGWGTDEDYGYYGDDEYYDEAY